MKTIMYTTAFVAIFCLVCAPMMAMAGTMDEGDAYETEFVNGWATTAPTIDGVIDLNEWTDAYAVEIAYEVENYTTYSNDTVYLYFSNDAEWFYFAMDLTPIIDDEESISIGIAVDENNDDDFTNNADDGFEVLLSSIGNATDQFLISNKGGLVAISFGESPNNDDDDHYMFEGAIPFSIMNGGELAMGDIIRCAFFAEVSSPQNETVIYPIDFDSDDMFDDVVDSSEWAEITLAEGDIEEGGTTSSNDYAFMMVGAGMLVFIVLLVFNKETMLVWIADGKERLLFGVMTLGNILIGLGIVQYLYDWLSYLGL